MATTTPLTKKMKADEEDILIDGDIVNDTFSTRAPKIKLNPVRFLFTDAGAFLLFKIFLFFAVVGAVLFALWSKIAGGILLVIALPVAALIWRYISVRAVEFQNAVLSPGIVIAQNPLSVLVLANMDCAGGDPVWGVKLGDCRSVKPFPNKIGQRIPCVTAFLGDGLDDSWEQMISTPLTSGTGNKKELAVALSRLDDEEEWQILEAAIQQKRIPEIGKTLRL